MVVTESTTVEVGIPSHRPKPALRLNPDRQTLQTALDVATEHAPDIERGRLCIGCREAGRLAVHPCTWSEWASAVIAFVPITTAGVAA